MTEFNDDSRRLRDICERFGVERLEVFGSVSRSDQRPDSDIDLLYVLKPGMRPDWSFFDLEDELAQHFGRPVDLVPLKAINVHIRERILGDAKPLYAA